ncbi:hypothetical protein HHK36_020042 [Tetracentron sinense]|uniref:Uncharacterized protein n=1 Tax=Tetracentron sinense TaxID=13715 RepID=A0A835DB95_TETSI|nr:hypothetical protein HHK36_020042 [Tetracentron sinense]
MELPNNSHHKIIVVCRITLTTPSKFHLLSVIMTKQGLIAGDVTRQTLPKAMLGRQAQPEGNMARQAVLEESWPDSKLREQRDDMLRQQAILICLANVQLMLQKRFENFEQDMYMGQEQPQNPGVHVYNPEHPGLHPFNQGGPQAQLHGGGVQTTLLHDHRARKVTPEQDARWDPSLGQGARQHLTLSSPQRREEGLTKQKEESRSYSSDLNYPPMVEQHYGTGCNRHDDDEEVLQANAPCWPVPKEARGDMVLLGRDQGVMQACLERVLFMVVEDGGVAAETAEDGGLNLVAVVALAAGGDRFSTDWDKAWSSFRKQGKKTLFSQFTPGKYVSWNPRRSNYPLSEEVDPIKRAKRSNLMLWTSPRFTLTGAIVVVTFLLIYTILAPVK